MLTDKTRESREARNNGELLVVLPWYPSAAETAFWQRLNAARLWRRETWKEEPEAFLVSLAEEVGRWNAKAIRAGLRLVVDLPEREMMFRPFRWGGLTKSLRQHFELCEFVIPAMR